jgi:hypothetical protein
MIKMRREHRTPGRRPHLRHHWQEHNTGRDDRWQECRDCGKKRPLRDLMGLRFYLPGGAA